MLLYQPKGGYCYNSDTHFLYDFILKSLSQFKNIRGELLDIGSGSGILGLLVCRDIPTLSLSQFEIQEDFQFLSLINSNCNKIKANMYKGCFIDKKIDKKFDVCISNPPFYNSNVIKSKNENIKMARYNDFMPLEKFISKVSAILKREGKFLFCYDVKQINEVLLLLDKYDLNVENMQFVYPKKEKDATLVLIYARKNSKSLTKVLPPLFVFHKDDFTVEVKNIYSMSSTYSIKVEI